MASRGLLEADCGGPNAIVRLAQHITRDQALKQDSLLPALQSQRRSIVNGQPQTFTPERLVEEFLSKDYGSSSAPQTFHMGQLMHEMQRIKQQQQIPHMVDDPQAALWANEFIQSHSRNSEWPWAKEFFDFQENRPNISQLNETPKAQISELEATNWVDESLSATAAQLLDEVGDKQFSNSEFMKFVETIKNNSAATTTDQVASDWAQEFESKKLEPAEAGGWAAEFEGSESTSQANDRDFWDNLQDEWEKIAKEDHLGEHPWLSDFREASSQLHEYTFEDENPVKDHPSPFEAGLEKLKEGNLPSAILYFEAAVQHNPEHKEAWLYLGTTHAENEQDPAAIAALKRALDLDSTNLTAWMSIAVSYTNESYQEQACHALSSWLSNHPRYQHLSQVTNLPQPSTNLTSIMSKQLMSPNKGKPAGPDLIFCCTKISFRPFEMYQRIMDMYLAAAQITPTEPDPDVQCGLGVLLNLSGDYDKAVDCFQAALRMHPNDALLWNRLGATLANSNRSEEAIAAYHRALEIAPGFIRSRYNLGISCISLGAHREAVEHFLSALNCQASSTAVVGFQKSASAMSENIWSTMRMALSLMSRSDLYSVVDSRDLNRLNQEFPNDVGTTQ